MRTRSRVGVPKWRCDSDWRLFPLLRLVVASFVLLNCAFQSTVFTRPIQRPKGNAVIVGVVFVAPREAPKPTVDNTQTSSALVEQFKNEQVFGKQIDIAKAIVSKHDASDQGIPGAASDGRYRFERQIAADRYYAAHLLGDLRDPRGVALLVRLLDDPETQSIVPWSLGQIGDKRAIPPLIAALDADDPSKRVLVIYALEALHAKEAVPRLMTLVNDDRKSRFGALVTVSEAAKAAIAKLR